MDRQQVRPSRLGWRGPAAALALLIHSVLGPGQLAAQHVAPGRPLFVERTAYFDIYYPEGLGADARRLASFADETLLELVPRFGADAPDKSGRIPVLLADGQADTNGYFTVSPSDRIVLFLAAPGAGEVLGAFHDRLGLLFRHELTHYVTTTRKSAFWKVASFLEGDLASPPYWLAPNSFVEGAAVASESLGGHGRLQDPEALSFISQFLIEGRRPTFWQASGARDLYPYASQYYYFGGAFSAWLARRHGEAAYASFWTGLSRGNPFVGLDKGLFSPGLFAEAFGESLDTAWKAFLDDASPKTRPGDLSRRLTRKPGAISAMTASGDTVLVADAARGAILRLDPASGNARTLLSSDGSVNALSLSPDGRYLLVSASVVEGEGSRSFVRAYDLRRSAWAGGALYGLREASWIGAGLSADAPANQSGTPLPPFVAVEPRLLDTDLVLVKEGKAQVIARGSPDLAFGNPGSLDGETFWALARDRGESRIMRFRPGDGGTAADGLPAGAEFLLLPEGSGPVKDLGLTSDGPLFSCALRLDQAFDLPGFALYRPARLDAVHGTLELAGQVFSGGVNRPLRLADGSYLYVGRFADGDYLCAAPSSEAFGWQSTDAVFVPAASGAGTTAEAAVAAGTAERSAYAHLSAQATEDERASALPLSLHTVRQPFLGTDLSSAGLVLAGSDIAQRLSWAAQAGWCWAVGGADLALDLSAKLPPLTLRLQAQDAFVPQADGKAWYRQAAGFLTASTDLHAWPSRKTLSALALAGLSVSAPATAGSPYASNWNGYSWAASVQAGFSDLRTPRFPPFIGEGHALSVSADLEGVEAAALPSPAAGFSAQASSQALRVRLSLWGLASLDGKARWSPAGRWINAGTTILPSALSAPWPAYREYKDLGLFGSLYAQGEAVLFPLSFEIQAAVTKGFYLRRIGLEVGARGAWLGGSRAAYAGTPALPDLAGGTVLASVHVAAVGEFSPLLGLFAAMSLAPRVELSYALLPGWSGDSRISADFTLGVSR